MLKTIVLGTLILITGTSLSRAQDAPNIIFSSPHRTHPELQGRPVNERARSQDERRFHYVPKPPHPTAGIRRLRRLKGGQDSGRHLAARRGSTNIAWQASPNCLARSLVGVLATIASLGRLTVNSTCRSPAHNRRVGGVHGSHHLNGNAVDFRMHGNTSAALAALRRDPRVGGLKHYGGGRFHIDAGTRRTW